jgi:hypothetical protein
MAEVTTISAIKGFDANLKCRGFQFAIGETYKHEGRVKACESGFHVVSGHPLAVFNYYAPAGSRFCKVEIGGKTCSDDGEKTAAEILTVGRELGLSDLVQESVQWVMDRSTPEGEVAKGYRGAASSTGYRGAASSTGERGAASSTGTQGAASSTGTQGAASSTGERGAAMASGKDGRVMGDNGSALFAVERGDWDGKTYPILSVASGIVGKGKIKPLVWYQAKGGELVEVKE